ncbi:hypothetical protein AB4874_08505 [Thioclava sp. 15-R06ZXC-3]|uniref:Uncharacterized protein n=1 Tax=Thioclava arctica TaxID=3238301 RepID=A0ABV3TL63_9RHOB
MSWISRLAARAPVPVFIAQGEGAPDALARLALNPAIHVVDSPRAACILLVAGRIPSALADCLNRLHDQLPHPRATVLWQSHAMEPFSDAVEVDASGDITNALSATFADLLAGDRPSEADILPDAPPNEWRGIGPHGQGGKGMMGGTPYGRAMAKTDDDIRDGLSLDAYTADFGPFLPMFPAGLALTLTLQGDMIQAVTVAHPPFEGDTAARERLLRLLGLSALALRSLHGQKGDGTFRRLVRLSRARAAIPADLGRLPDGSDVRSRFDAMVAGLQTAPASDTDMTLGDLLVGLEWHEALLVINSLDNATLRGVCARMDASPHSTNDDTHADHDMHAEHMG